MTKDELFNQAADIENRLAAMMGDKELQDIINFTKRQLVALEAEMAKRKAKQEGEGFAV